jgi:hypothetical protein
MVPDEQLAAAYSLLKLLNKGDRTMRHQIKFSILVLAAVCLLAPLAAAMDEMQQREFDRIAGLKMADLTREAAALLERKYPDEDWEVYDFPSYVFSSESVEVGYKIAVKAPSLLGNPDIAVRGEDLAIPCYCFCDSMGHKNLLHCFWKEGKVGGEFDDHAAGCNICYGQAMLAFLWKNLGTSDQEILKGMETKFDRLKKER